MTEKLHSFQVLFAHLAAVVETGYTFPVNIVVVAKCQFGHRAMLTVILALSVEQS